MCELHITFFKDGKINDNEKKKLIYQEKEYVDETSETSINYGIAFCLPKKILSLATFKWFFHVMKILVNWNYYVFKYT